MSEQKLQEFSPEHSTYERPTQDWVCGRAAQNRSCALGPDPRGRCQGSFGCPPRREGDTWRCTRSVLQGGSCSSGPHPDGRCSVWTPPCQPVRTLRKRRRVLGFSAAALALGAALVGLGGRWRTHLLSPGPLTLAHAQILEGNAEATCETCHPAGEQSGLAWVEWSRATSGAQSERCLECHGGSPGLGDHPREAHSVMPEQLERPVESESRGESEASVAPETTAVRAASIWDDLTLARSLPGVSARLPVPHGPKGELECSTCHREHHGAGFDLEAMDDDSCQACHRAQFVSLSEGHPEFSGWPYTQPTRIAFSHREHRDEHFGDRAFECTDCHETDLRGDSMRVRGFDAACGDCHSPGAYQGPPPEPFEVGESREGMPVLQLPAVDEEMLADMEIGEWPLYAGLDLDEPLGGFMRLLIRGSEGLEGVDDITYVYDLDAADQARVVWAVKELFQSLASQNPADGLRTLCDRLERALGRELAKSEISLLAANLSTDTLLAAQRAWFPNVGDEMAARARGEAVPSRFVESVEGPIPSSDALGGWYRDDRTFAIRYRPMGHADPFLKSWLDVVADAAGGDASFEMLLEEIGIPEATGRCVECHTVAVGNQGWGRADAQVSPIHWQAKRRDLGIRGFTRYSHRAHLLQPGLRDCVTCHVTDLDGEAPAAGDFFHMQKETCASCHTASAAGDGCLTCHNYHVGRLTAAVP